MTSEELVAAGIAPVEREVHKSENTQPREDNPVPDSVPGSENREEGEIRSENASGAEEDLADVDADVKDLMAAKSSKSYPPSFVFGESKVTTNMIRKYESAGFSLLATVAPPLMSKLQLPKLTRLSCFATSLPAD
jgi:hypothetical protein